MENFPGAWRIFRNSVTWRIAISHTISHAQIEGAHSVDSSSSRHLLSPSERRAPSLRLFLSHTLRRETLSLSLSLSLSRTLILLHTKENSLTHSLPNLSLSNTQSVTYTHSVTNLPVSHTEWRAHSLATPISHTVWRAHSH